MNRKMTVAAQVAVAMQGLESVMLRLGVDAKDKLLTQAFLWTEVERHAKNAREAALTAVQDTFFIDKAKLKTGIHEALAQTRTFQVNVEVSQPYRRFSEDELAQLLLKSKQKVPLAVTKEAVEAAKLPGSPRVSFKIVQRGVEEAAKEAKIAQMKAKANG